jgi:hypothetical protein
MRSWGANVGAELRQKKGLLLTEIKNLDSRSDSVGLSTEEWLRRYALEDSLVEIYRGEEVYWRQRTQPISMLLPTTDVGNAPSPAFGIEIIFWRMPEISPIMFTPSIRSSLRQVPGQGSR